MKKQARPKTLKSLADDLHEVYDRLKEGKIEETTAAALANVADKIIDSAKTRLKYKSFNGSIGKISELE